MCPRGFSHALNTNLTRIFRFEITVPRYINFYQEVINFYKIIKKVKYMKEIVLKKFKEHIFLHESIFIGTVAQISATYWCNLMQKINISHAFNDILKF